jgi:hypothetical protein
MIEVLKYLQPNATVPIDMETTAMLVNALRQAIKELESQEPVCPECKAEVLYECVACSSNNYPPQRTWVGLTDEEISELIRATHNTGSFVRAIQAKLKEKNS